MVVLSYSVIYYIYIPGTLGPCFHYWCSVDGICKLSDTLWPVGRVRLFADYTISLSSLYRSSIGRVFRSPLRRRHKMAALPLPVAILDDLIPGMRSSKMAAGSGRAAILRRRRNGGRKTRPRFWMTSFPASPSWIQDGDGGNDVWRTSRRPWRRSTDVCPIHESCRSLTLLFSEIKKIKSIWSLASPRHYPSDWVSCQLATTRKSISLHMSKVFHNFRHVQTDHFRVVASGQLTQSLG